MLRGPVFLARRVVRRRHRSHRAAPPAVPLPLRCAVAAAGELAAMRWLAVADVAAAAW
jgi:hypothetical protein